MLRLATWSIAGEGVPEQTKTEFSEDFSVELNLFASRAKHIKPTSRIQAALRRVSMSGGASNSQGLRLGLWFRYWLGQRLAPYHGTPPHVARRMLQLARVTADDRVVDLGCGDARLLIAAAKHHGARGYGVELDSNLFRAAVTAIKEEGLANMITVEQRDAFTVDLSTATVVALYLTVKGNMKLYPKLVQQLPPGARVVSFCWPFESLEPSNTTRVDGIDLFLYEFNKQK